MKTKLLVVLLPGVTLHLEAFQEMGGMRPSAACMQGSPQYAKLRTELSKGAARQVRPAHSTALPPPVE